MIQEGLTLLWNLMNKRSRDYGIRMFQFSMYGGVLYVEISKCPSEGYTEETSEKHIPPKKIKVYQIGGGSPYNRTRIGFNTDEVEKSFMLWEKQKNG
ncbi:hypothetical protein KUV80_10790 [Fictibacillus nanhaiensis]|uniref:hypothetical protein n=1 Tax=Fictibacillus nanhaiensis TaxID=742169 RepID=UPI001C9655E9|nr:hypothetical protein [Fictibacillus nanhaiensis]MBY6037146.1 hypothetical protein [Fictibacillus nanhaiensis]